LKECNSEVELSSKTPNKKYLKKRKKKIKIESTWQCPLITPATFLLSSQKATAEGEGA